MTPPNRTEPFGDLAAFTDLPAFCALARTTALALAPDGARLVATVQRLDDDAATYRSALWEIPLDGGAGPVRLTRSDEGESGAAFRPDGTLLFTSSRPVGTASEADEHTHDGAVLYTLPPRGEPVAVARRPGGLSGPVVAARSGHVVLTGTRLARSGDDDDARRRSRRQDRKITAVLHTGMPVRYWDRDLDETVTRLLLLGPDGEVTDLAPDAAGELDPCSYSVTADGTTVAVSWRARRPHGRSPYTVRLIDTATREHRVLADADGWQFSSPVIAPDASQIAVEAERDGSFERAPAGGLALLDPATGERRPVETGELYPTEWAWTPDSRHLVVSGDLHGRGAVVLVDPRAGTVVRRLAADASYSNLCVAADAVYALRSAIDSPPAPVRLALGATDQTPDALPDPAPVPPLPGVIEELHVDGPHGAPVHAWLCRPAGDGPFPVMQWIHGGPFLSYNAWSWRWSPWVFVAHGWAVVLPDPALSTGYGQATIERAWPYRLDVVWDEVAAVLDAVTARPDLRADRPALLGGSFGGLMTNWIAGHTDRFAAIVTHAGLWALDQQHATTDAAAFKTMILGTAADHPDWYAAFSPHHHVAAIRTPMLITHGLRDYRVPFSEGLRLWWDLVSRWPGDPQTMPHRFLQFSGENHWVQSPANAEIWYDTVLGFCAEHVLGEPRTCSDLL